MNQREKFKTVQEHIESGRYDDARLLLMTMPGVTKAEEWLARLNQDAPPSDPMLFSQVRETIGGVVQEYEGAERRRKRRGCLWRTVLMTIFLICACSWVLPFLTVTNNVAGNNSPSWLQTVTNNPVSERMSTFTQQRVIAPGLGAVSPILESACDRQGMTTEMTMTCRQLVDDIERCMSQGDGIGVCVDRVGREACRTISSGDTQVFNQCVDQMNQLSQYLP